MSFIFCSIVSNGQSRFVENIGQLPQNVFAKSDIQGGVLFVEKAKFTFAFFDEEKLSANH